MVFPYHILIVDDEEGMREFLSILLENEGFKVYCASGGIEALKILEEKNYINLVVTDIRMPDIDGLSLLRKIKELNSEIPVIMITAYAKDLDTAIKSINLGASNYLIKPFSNEEFINAIKKVLNEKLESEKSISIEEEDIISLKVNEVEIVGKNPKILKIIETIKKVANLNSTVLVMGESGTGKELVARAIHYLSYRKNKPFIAINCGAIPETLLESELFGHKKGAFTGAYEDKKGLLEISNGGTFFLDEISETSLSFQVKLNRFLSTKTFTRIGDYKPLTVDVRIIAATNKDLEEEVEKGNFRKDLFYRLNVIPIYLPPLRERKEDIPLLVQYFIKKYCRINNKEVFEVTKSAMELFKKYKWPGNVRELENIIERIISLETRNKIYPDSLPPHIRFATPTVFNKSKIKFNIEDSIDLDKILDDIEKELITEALKKANGNKQIAANLLNISLRSLNYRLKKHKILDEF